MSETVSQELRTPQLAELLDVNPGTVRGWVERNLLKACPTLGGQLRFTIQDVINSYAAKGSEPPPKFMAFAHGEWVDAMRRVSDADLIAEVKRRGLVVPTVSA